MRKTTSRRTSGRTKKHQRLQHVTQHRSLVVMWLALESRDEEVENEQKRPVGLLPSFGEH